jgi:hypothetical protein
MRLDGKKISIRVISDIKSILPIEYQWNAIVHKSSNNPFLLSEFAKQFIEHIPQGYTPLILIISNNQTIIGIAPLKTKMNLIGRYVEFLNPSWCSDFIFDEQHRETCIKYTFDYMFNTLKCKYASFTLSSDSPNLKLIEQQCKLKNIHLKTLPENGHRIIPIKSTWTEYEASRTRNFRKKFKGIKRNLDQAGLWKTICVGGKEQWDVTEKTLNIEEKSWKETWRMHSKRESDWFLIAVLKAAPQLAKIEPSFKWNVWFLELKNQIISYVLSIEYKEVAYLVKTSYDEQYKRFYPGIAIQNVAIREMFINSQNKYVDFLTDLPYHQTWTDECLPRNKVQLTKGAIATILYSISKNKFVTKIISVIFRR